jgi:hypothetical protein
MLPSELGRGFGEGQGHQILICDRDRKWTHGFRHILQGAGVRIVLTPVQAPNANAYAERFVRSIREECLDRLIFFGERRLLRARELTPRAPAQGVAPVPTAQQELGRLTSVVTPPLPDAAALTKLVTAKVNNWHGLMGRRVGQAREILRQVLVGRFAFTPQADGSWDFVGYADPGALFAGTVLADRNNCVVAPTGFEPVFQP